MASITGSKRFSRSWDRKASRSSSAIPAPPSCRSWTGSRARSTPRSC